MKTIALEEQDTNFNSMTDHLEKKRKNNCMTIIVNVYPLY